MGHGIERIVEAGNQVDCFGYAGESPWHRLGQRVGERGDPSVSVFDIERAARADWSVVTDTVKTTSDDQELADVQALLRDRDRKVLGFTTSRYSIIQHRVLGEVLQTLVTNNRATWESVGVLNDGQRVFYSVRLKTKIEPLPGDETELFAIATTSHDGTATANLILSSVRVVCQNTLTQALSRNVDKVSVRHTGRAGDMLARAREVVLGVEDRVGQMDEAMRFMTGIVLSERQSQKFLDMVCPVPALPPAELFSRFGEEKQQRFLYSQDLAMRVQSRIRELHETGDGHDLRGVRGTSYGWLQATTNYATHEMRSKSKIESNLVGDASKLGRRAFAVLTERHERAELLAA